MGGTLGQMASESPSETERFYGSMNVKAWLRRRVKSGCEQRAGWPEVGGRAAAGGAWEPS